MPNPTVLAAATGLPMPSPDLTPVMRAAHAAARAMPARLPYAERFAMALRKAWATVRADMLATLRSAIAARVERLLAALDAIDGDPDWEPSLGGDYGSGRYALDAEHDTADDEFSLGAPIGDGDREHWDQGMVGDVEVDELGPMARITYPGPGEAAEARKAALMLIASIPRRDIPKCVTVLL